MNTQNNTLNQAISVASPYLKGLAIIGIILHHYFRGLYGITQNVQWLYSANFLNVFAEAFFSSVSAAFIASFYYLGYMGVSIFFILSGWGLAVSALKRNLATFDCLDFYKKRAQKIYPLYIASLVFFGLLFYGQGNLGALEEILRSLSKLLFLSNYSPAEIFTINPSFWFLSTVAILYILFPVIFAATSKKPKITLAASLLIAYISTISIQFSALQHAHPFFAMGGFPLAKLGEFTLGVFIAIRASQTQMSLNFLLKRPRYVMMAISMLLLGLFAFTNQLAYPLHPILIALPLLFFYLKLHASANIWPKILKPIAYAGTYSYSAFLLHRPFVDTWIGITDQTASPIVFGLLFLLASVTLTSWFEIICSKTTTPLLGGLIDRAFKIFSFQNTKKSLPADL